MASKSIELVGGESQHTNPSKRTLPHPSTKSSRKNTSLRVSENNSGDTPPLSCTLPDKLKSFCASHAVVMDLKSKWTERRSAVRVAIRDARQALLSWLQSRRVERVLLPPELMQMVSKEDHAPTTLVLRTKVHVTRKAPSVNMLVDAWFQSEKDPLLNLLVRDGLRKEEAREITFLRAVKKQMARRQLYADVVEHGGAEDTGPHALEEEGKASAHVTNNARVLLPPQTSSAQEASLTKDIAELCVHLRTQKMAQQTLKEDAKRACDGAALAFQTAQREVVEACLSQAPDLLEACRHHRRAGQPLGQVQVATDRVMNVRMTVPTTCPRAGIKIIESDLVPQVVQKLMAPSSHKDSSHPQEVIAAIWRSFQDKSRREKPPQVKIRKQQLYNTRSAAKRQRESSKI